MKKRIGQILLEVAADVKKMRSSMEASKNIVKKNTEQMSALAKRAKQAIVGMVGLESLRRLKDWQRSIIDSADEIAKMSKRTGIAAEELSALGYAAKLSNVNTTELNTGLRRLARNMDSAKNGTGDAHKAFRELGIVITDNEGNLRRTEDVINDIAERFSQMADGAQKSAYASRIFGRTGTSLIPMLNEGKEGLKNMRKEADQLGITISNKTAREAERFNDDMARLASVSKGAGLAIAKDLLPHLNLFGRELQKNINKLGGSDGFLATLSKTARVGLLGEDWSATDRERVAELEGLIAEKQRAFKKLTKLRDDQRKDLEALKKQQSRPPELSLDMFGGGTGFTTINETQRLTTQVDQYTSKLAAAGQKIVNMQREHHKLSEKIKRQNALDLKDAWTFKTDTGYMDQLVAQQETQNQALEEATSFAEKMKKLREESSRQIEDIGVSAIAEEAKRVEEANRRIVEDYEQRVRAVKHMTDSWTSGFASRIAEATTTGKIRFKDMANSMLKDMIRLASFNVFKPIMSKAFGGILGGPAFFGTKGHAGADLPKFADGGVVGGPTIAQVGEQGAEAILPLVRSGGKLGVQASGGSSAPTIHIHDNRGSGQQVDVQTSSDGQRIDIYIRDMMDGLIRSGEMDAAAGWAWGLNRQGIRRGG